jgi:hypothetical protein
MGHYGIGPLTAITMLAELGDASRFSSSREAVRYAGLHITVHQSDARRAPGHLPRQGPVALRWALFEAAQMRSAGPALPTTTTTPPRPRGWAATAPASRLRKLLKRSYPRCANSARKHCSPHDRRAARAALTHADAPRPAPGMLLPPPPSVRRPS